MEVAKEILNQLGGNKFLAMTGSKNLAGGDNFLSMRLAKNQSRANYLKITLTPLDTYNMEFINYVKAKVKVDASNKAVSYKPDKLVAVRSLDGVYGDQLQEIFASVTGLRTHL